MTFKPTQTQRSVLLALKFTRCNDVRPDSQSIETMRVTSISALFADLEHIAVEIFDDGSEADLLRRFWSSIRAGDRVFAAGVAAGLSLLRHRSWILGVLPSAEIDLRGVEEWDTALMWKSGYIPYPLFDEPESLTEVETPFDEAYDEVTVHSRD